MRFDCSGSAAPHRTVHRHRCSSPRVTSVEVVRRNDLPAGEGEQVGSALFGLGATRRDAHTVPIASTWSSVSSAARPARSVGHGPDRPAPAASSFIVVFGGHDATWSSSARDLGSELCERVSFDAETFGFGSSCRGAARLPGRRLSAPGLTAGPVPRHGWTSCKLVTVCRCRTTVGVVRRRLHVQWSTDPAASEPPEGAGSSVVVQVDDEAAKWARAVELHPELPEIAVQRGRRDAARLANITSSTPQRTVTVERPA